MADDPSKTPGTPAKSPSPQNIPLAKIHDLPGVFIPKQPDKSYGGLVSSIQASGVKEPVILRLREDGEYQLVAGYRRRRGSELAKKQDIPAFVYEMTLQEAVDYHRRVQSNPNLPIPGKLIAAPTKDTPIKDDLTPKEAKKTQTAHAADPKPKEQSTEGKAETKPDNKAPAEAPKETAPAKNSPTTEEGKESLSTLAETDSNPKEQLTVGKAEAKPDSKAPAEAPKETVSVKGSPATKEGKESLSTPATTDPNPKEQPAEGKGETKADGKPPIKAPKETASTKAPPASKEDKETQATHPTTASKPKEQPTEGKAEAKPDGKAPAEVPKDTTPSKDSPATKEAQGPAAPDKHTEAKTVAAGPAAKGPAGTQITQVFPDRLAPPDEASLKDLPSPKEGESFFILLHSGYLEKSKYNTITVDQNSEDYRELKKSIELNGVKDPVLTRINPDGGGLEIVSGQRRHMIAKELNYPVPAIIQKLDDADVKILVNDGNLHRPHISAYDLARALRGKMEGMKQKAGRKKKGAPTAEELNSDEKLAQEMGMSVSKLNRIIRLSEATKDVCDRVDDGTLALSIASAVSFLKPGNQDEVLHLMDLGYRVSTERVEYLKKVEKAGKLDENSMRLVLEGENVLEPPKVIPMPVPETPPQQPTAVTDDPVLPPSPDMKSLEEQAAPTPPAQTSPAEKTPAPVSGEKPKEAATTPPTKEPDESKGEQERPEYTKIILTGDRLRKYFPDVSMTPREIEESIYDALEERRQRLEKQKQKEAIFKKSGPAR